MIARDVGLVELDAGDPLRALGVGETSEIGARATRDRSCVVVQVEPGVAVKRAKRPLLATGMAAATDEVAMTVTSAVRSVS
jgi:hypothetical protein